MGPLIRSQPSACEIRARLARRETTAEAIVREAIARISELEPRLHAWKCLDTELAIAQARGLDRQFVAGDAVGTLAGVPLAVKDIFDTADLPTGYGSPIYEGHRPARDAHGVALVKGAGAVVMGKTVTTEFAYFLPGATANPWNAAHTPGGSSSGSAVAVACGMVPLAFGSQTAGSLIRPASYCGVFAIKPSHGTVATTGVKAFSESLDTLGWLANSADDLELMRAALVSQAFEPLPVLPGMRLASCLTHEASFLDGAGQAAWEAAHRLLSSGGVAVDRLALPETLRNLMSAQKTVMAYEAARSLAYEVSEHAGRVSVHIHDLVKTGQDTTLDVYQAALELAKHARKRVRMLMEGVDAILAPAAPGEAPVGLASTGDPVFSRVWTLLGLPCVNVPGLFGPNGLPIGMQLVGRFGRERHLLAVAACLHRVLAASY